MNRLRRLSLALVAALLLGGLPACGEDDVSREADKAGQEAEQAGEKAKKEGEKAADEAEKAKEDVDGQ
jgi:hypothetical protein